ncbi:MAG: hypothetical protein KDD61_18475, partial [Bdellovibrionales bacterium]|nr:hypothetical protein [Bdellovibrionales bacterium]
MNKNTSRPSPSQYSSPKDYLLAMIQYRKETEAAFSVVRAAKNLRRVSPALISLIRKGDRRITLDRANELAQLANFNSTERAYFINWIKGQEQGEPEEIKSSRESRIGRRKVVSTHLLSDWINVYVKDLFQ